jgi:hypothetical protein
MSERMVIELRRAGRRKMFGEKDTAAHEHIDDGLSGEFKLSEH